MNFPLFQPYGRQYEMGQPLVNGAIYYHNGVPYTYQNGVAVFTPGPDGQPCAVGVTPTTGKGTILSWGFIKTL